MKRTIVVWLYCGVDEKLEAVHVPVNMWVGMMERTVMSMMDRKTNDCVRSHPYGCEAGRVG